eukprot:COSAG06_NODE_26107_length_621_cov_1.296935_1_plen_98_part_00
MCRSGTATTVWACCRRNQPVRSKKPGLLRWHFILKTISLPRQARDTHRRLEKEMRFLTDDPPLELGSGLPVDAVGGDFNVYSLDRSILLCVLFLEPF